MKKEKDNQELLMGKDWDGNQIHIYNEELHKGEYIDVQAMLKDTLDKLDKIEKIEIFMTFLNFTTKALALCLFQFIMTQFLNMILYLLYALLELVAFGAAFAVVLNARIISALFGVNVFCLGQKYSIIRQLHLFTPENLQKSLEIYYFNSQIYVKNTIQNIKNLYRKDINIRNKQLKDEIQQAKNFIKRSIIEHNDVQGNSFSNYYLICLFPNQNS